MGLNKALTTTMDETKNILKLRMSLPTAENYNSQICHVRISSSIATLENETVEV